MTREGKVKDELVAIACKIPGLRIWRNNIMVVPRENKGGVHYYRAGLIPGSADFIGLYWGIFVAVECKATSKDKLTKKQEKFSAMVIKLGGISLRIDSSNLQQFEALLNEDMERVNHARNPIGKG